MVRRSFMKLENWTVVHIELLPIYRISTCYHGCIFCIFIFSDNCVLLITFFKGERLVCNTNLLLVRLNLLYTMKYVQISNPDICRPSVCLSFLIHLFLCLSAHLPLCLQHFHISQFLSRISYPILRKPSAKKSLSLWMKKVKTQFKFIEIKVLFVWRKRWTILVYFLFYLVIIYGNRYF